MTEIAASGSTPSLSITTYDPFRIVGLDAVADLIAGDRRVRLMPRRQPDGTIVTEVDLDLASVPPGCRHPRLAFTRPLDNHTTSDALLVGAGLEPLALRVKGLARSPPAPLWRHRDAAAGLAQDRRGAALARASEDLPPRPADRRAAGAAAQTPGRPRREAGRPTRC